MREFILQLPKDLARAEFDTAGGHVRQPFVSLGAILRTPGSCATTGTIVPVVAVKSFCQCRLRGTLGYEMSAPSQAATGPADYFAVFGLPRKLRIELSWLEQKFLQLSWKLHPDNFVNASEGERELSLKRSSELNDAYRVLRDPLARVEYLLGNRRRTQGRAKRNSRRRRNCWKKSLS